MYADVGNGVCSEWSVHSVGMDERVACVEPRHESSVRTDATSRAGLVRGEGSTYVSAKSNQ